MFKNIQIANLPKNGIDLTGEPGLRQLVLKQSLILTAEFKDSEDVLVFEVPAGLKTDMSSIPVGWLMSGCALASSAAVYGLPAELTQVVVPGIWGSAWLLIRFRPRSIFPAGVFHDAAYAGAYLAKIRRKMKDGSIVEILVRLCRKTADMLYFCLVRANIFQKDTSTAAGRFVAASSFYAALRVFAAGHYNSEANNPTSGELVV